MRPFSEENRLEPIRTIWAFILGPAIGAATASLIIAVSADLPLDAALQHAPVIAFYLVYPLAWFVGAPINWGLRWFFRPSLPGTIAIGMTTACLPLVYEIVLSSTREQALEFFGSVGQAWPMPLEFLAYGAITGAVIWGISSAGGPKATTTVYGRHRGPLGPTA